MLLLLAGREEEEEEDAGEERVVVPACASCNNEAGVGGVTKVEARILLPSPPHTYPVVLIIYQCTISDGVGRGSDRRSKIWTFRSRGMCGRFDVPCSSPPQHGGVGGDGCQ